MLDAAEPWPVQFVRGTGLSWSDLNWRRTACSMADPLLI
jgi:hypothetical protein